MTVTTLSNYTQPNEVTSALPVVLDLSLFTCRVCSIVAVQLGNENVLKKNKKKNCRILDSDWLLLCLLYWDMYDLLLREKKG